MSTIKEIANHLGIAHSTVSRAFDPASRIGPVTRKRILDYASEIEYKPNAIAQSLKNKRTKTIGLILSDIENVFFTEMLKYIEISLKSYGYRLLISFVQTDITTERDCLELMESSRVDALIMTPLGRQNEEYVKKLMKQCYVIQLFNSNYDDIDSLTIDDVDGVRQGAVSFSTAVTVSCCI